jgi:drug/metabolite transporter (DMT)-like permease
MSPFVTFLLSFLVSLASLGASVVLKNWHVMPLWGAVLATVALLGLASLAEIEVLRRARFAEVILLIIALEIAIAFVLSVALMGESYLPRQALGMGVILIGMGLVLSAPSARDAAEPDQRERLP